MSADAASKTQRDLSRQAAIDPPREPATGFACRDQVARSKVCRSD
jgi:hypothetical protein